ncbi:uncharacterized protein LOC117117773 [Anneissia japonica]|uniref:uncharacterized protein LOC117117773 n=1 Tax=Anneissia japonica TaxID=1529436 RepID=UPI001425924F|nr:uncharacterized protein LOC117117773 [Anneissia japonica]
MKTYMIFLREGDFSSALTMHAAASVLERPIKSIYQPLNGLVDDCFVMLNRHFTPRTWTVFASSGSTAGTWTPNHFIPLLPVRIDKTVTITIKSSPEPELLKHGRATSTPHQSFDDDWLSLEESRTRKCKVRTRKSSPALQPKRKAAWENTFIFILLKESTVHEDISIDRITIRIHIRIQAIFFLSFCNNFFQPDKMSCLETM